jgi:hypothetical protein
MALGIGPGKRAGAARYGIMPTPRARRDGARFTPAVLKEQAQGQ